MKLSDNQQILLRMLPGVDRLLELCKNDSHFAEIPKTVVINAIRLSLDSQRKLILADDRGIDEQSLAESRIMKRVRDAASDAMAFNLKPVINATGVVVHTNLGRSLLPAEALENLAPVAGRYSNLEYDLEAGKRGSRQQRRGYSVRNQRC